MKTEISRDSHQTDKRYSGVYQQQGRMLTDADWNELVEILKDRLNNTLKDVVGNRDGGIGGTPRHRALRVIADAGSTFKIQPGVVYADGMAAHLPGGIDIDFDNQPDFPVSPVPTGNYRLYADIWERTVTHLLDERLLDQALHGADTCTRKQTMVQVKWCTSTIDPEQSDKNPGKGNVQLSVTLLPKSTLPDPCDPCAALLEIESRVGNYLFRVEVHTVSGDADSPAALTLKWSGENAAEQHPVGDEPESFKGSKWVYEFFDEDGEKQLGVQLVPGFSADRDELLKGYPGVIPGRRFVRRWDGFCKLEFSGGSWGVIDEFDSSQSGSESISFTEIVTDQLIVNLDTLKLEFELNNSIVVGDYWLAEVREAAYDDADAETGKLLVNQTPHGIEHRYLTLGEVLGDTLQDNAEADRKYAFPALTEMTRLFVAGGDGQEIMPGEALPQALRVGVANGEWPVAGATVRFQIDAGGGTLSEINGGRTSPEGIAACAWSPDAVIGDLYRVKASLVNLDDSADAAMDFTPPVFFCANLITADQVAYQSACLPATADTVHNLLTTDSLLDLGADNYYSVKEILDALLCSLRARHIPYDPTNLSRWQDVNQEEGAASPATVQQAIDALLENLHSEDISYPLPDCSPATNTLKSYLQSHIAHLAGDAPDRYRIKALWDALLCHLDAAKLPYNPNQTSATNARWRDIKEQPGSGDLVEPNTVQEAIDVLILWLESTDIRYEVPPCGDNTTPTVRSLLGLTPGTTKLDLVLDELLCNLQAQHLPFVSANCTHVEPTVKTALGIGQISTVSDVLQALICDLDAAATPYDSTIQQNLWQNDDPDTVQQAIDLLLQRVLDPRVVAQLISHISNQNNPHRVTADQTGAIADTTGSVNENHLVDGSVPISKLKKTLRHSGSVSITSGGGYGFSLYDTAISWLPMEHVFPLVSAYSPTNGAEFSVEERYRSSGNGSRLIRSMHYTNLSDFTITLYYRIYVLHEF
ncbi:MAG: hypothetical protein GY820_45645 [Gammaproteobacteria bacterium]|nr:hypothetical protein [Gammaproteobacteria bacterium]